MKDELIVQLKNTMLNSVLEQEFMQNVLSNYWSIAPKRASLEHKENMKEFNKHTSSSIAKIINEGQLTKF